MTSLRIDDGGCAAMALNAAQQFQSFVIGLIRLPYPTPEPSP